MLYKYNKSKRYSFNFSFSDNQQAILRNTQPNINEGQRDKRPFVCVRAYMKQTSNTFHISSETTSSAKETRTGAQPMKIARVDVKWWRKKEGRQRPTPYRRECQNKRTLPPQGCFQVFKFFDAWRTIPASFFFFFLRCLSPTSQFAGRNVFREVNEEIKKRRRHTYRRELAEEAASSTVKIGIHTRKYYPRHHCQGKWIKGRAIILRPSAGKVRTK